MQGWIIGSRGSGWSLKYVGPKPYRALKVGTLELGPEAN